jgi:hypothetical protein
MGMESIMGSLKKILYLNVSSMNQEGAVTALSRFANSHEFRYYHYDEGKEAQFHYEGEVDHNILRKVRETNPDLIIYSGPAGGKCLPRTDTLLSLREKRKTIGYFLDGGCPDWHALLESYKQQNVFDLTVNTDGNETWPQRSQDITLWQPVDESYYERDIAKDIHLGFAGGQGSSHRQKAIHALQDQFALICAERDEKWGSYHKFADFMRRCQMTVNFPGTGSGKAFHLKNRVLEAGFAKCMLFEETNPITPKYFEPGIDYIEYRDLDHLIQLLKIEWSPATIELFANKLHAKSQNYTSHKFWERIFQALPL